MCFLSKHNKLLKTEDNAAQPCCLKASLLSLYVKKMITEQTSRSDVSYFPWQPLFASVQSRPREAQSGS